MANVFDADGRTLYEVLGVPETASPDEINKAFRETSTELHPDRNKDPEAAERFKLLAHARDELTRPERRSVYDEQLRQARPAPSARRGRSSDPRVEVFQQLLDSVLSSGFVTPFPKPSMPRPSDVEIKQFLARRDFRGAAEVAERNGDTRTFHEMLTLDLMDLVSKGHTQKASDYRFHNAPVRHNLVSQIKLGEMLRSIEFTDPAQLEGAIEYAGKAKLGPISQQIQRVRVGCLVRDGRLTEAFDRARETPLRDQTGLNLISDYVRDALIGVLVRDGRIREAARFAEETGAPSGSFISAGLSSSVVERGDRARQWLEDGLERDVTTLLQKLDVQHLTAEFLKSNDSVAKKWGVGFPQQDHAVRHS